MKGNISIRLAFIMCTETRLEQRYGEFANTPRRRRVGAGREKNVSETLAAWMRCKTGGKQQVGAAGTSGARTRQCFSRRFCSEEEEMWEEAEEEEESASSLLSFPLLSQAARTNRFTLDIPETRRNPCFVVFLLCSVDRYGGFKFTTRRRSSAWNAPLPHF